MSPTASPVPRRIDRCAKGLTETALLGLVETDRAGWMKVRPEVGCAA